MSLTLKTNAELEQEKIINELEKCYGVDFVNFEEKQISLDGLFTFEEIENIYIKFSKLMELD